MNTVPSPILEAARVGDVAYLRVTGRATFTAGPALKQFGAASIKAGCTRIVVDAVACESMDSTFLGVLAGLAGRLTRETGGGIRMLNAGERLYEVIETLGINQLLECRRLGVKPEPLVEPPGLLRPVEAPAPTPVAARSVMLEAHTELAAMSQENQLRFRDVLTYLREQQGDGASP